MLNTLNSTNIDGSQDHKLKQQEELSSFRKDDDFKNITPTEKVTTWFDNVLDKNLRSEINVTMVIDFVKTKLSHINGLVLSTNSSNLPKELLHHGGIPSPMQLNTKEQSTAPKVFTTSQNISSDCVRRFERLFFDFLRFKPYALKGKDFFIFKFL